MQGRKQLPDLFLFNNDKETRRTQRHDPREKNRGVVKGEIEKWRIKKKKEKTTEKKILERGEKTSDFDNERDPETTT